MITNANKVLHKFAAGWNICLSAQALILQNPQGHHILTVALDGATTLMRQIKLFIRRIKSLFTPARIQQNICPVRTLRLGYDGTLWRGLAYGPRGLLWRKAHAV